MLTEADILESVKWRLHGVPEHTVEIGLQSAFDLIGTLTNIREDDKPVSDVLDRLSVPSDRRSPWGLLCALIAVAAHKRRNRPRFWSAGLEVRQAYLQAHRSPRNGKDKLSELIVRHLATHPGVSPSVLFDELSSQATYGVDFTVIGYDCEQDLLTINSDGRGKLKDISRSAFIRRVQRIREEMTRHHPESVAPSIESEAGEMITEVGGNDAAEVSSSSCPSDADAPRYRGRAVVEIPDTELVQLSASPLVPMSMRRVMGEEIQRRSMAIDQTAPMVVPEAEHSASNPLREVVVKEPTITPGNEVVPATELLEKNGNASVRVEALPEVREGGGNATTPAAMVTDDQEVQLQRETASILERDTNED